MECKIIAVGKRRDGGTRYWCLEHHANATAKYGVAADKCVAADDPPITSEETLHLDFADYPGGIALWGSVPAVYDTTNQPTDRGIHVHAREARGGLKDIDRTYRRLRIPHRVDLLSDGWVDVDEIDAINYMVSSVFGFETIPVKCIYCGFPHLDRDWFAVHSHRKHQCHGCGRQFSDTGVGVGNPIAELRQILCAVPSKKRKASDSISIKQRDYPGGIQIWGSNPAILWTSKDPEMTGIHLHAFKTSEQEMPDVDETYAKVTIDGIKLDPEQVRTYMAQSAMPHLEGRVVDLVCPHCGEPHFERGELAFSPHIDHDCHSCGKTFHASGQKKKTIGNPFVGMREMLAQNAIRPVREDKLGLRPETI
jgi:transposase-like protein